MPLFKKGKGKEKKPKGTKPKSRGGIRDVLLGRARKGRVKGAEIDITVELLSGLGFVTFKPLRPEYKILESYYVYEPFAKVTIAMTPEGPTYFVTEVELEPEEYPIIGKLIEILFHEIRTTELPQDIRKFVFEELGRIMERYRTKFGIVGVRRYKILYYMERNLLGFGPIDPLMRDPNIEDISCDGVGKPIYVWHRKYESIPTNIVINDINYLNALIMKFAHMAGKHVSTAYPVVDAMLPGKHRFAATFGTEVSPKGPTFTIRKFREKPFSVTELIRYGTIDSLTAAYLWTLIEHGRTVMIAGGTGAGKTTLLNVLSLFIKPGMKIVTVEDIPELNLPHENWVQLISRPSYIVGAKTGEVSLFDLVKLSLRYRPDYLIVGEVRGEEAYVLFQALASVSYDTPILIKDPKGEVSLVKIGEFIDKFYEEGEEWVPKPLEGYYVLSHDGFRTLWKPIKYVLRHRANEVYEIVSEGGGRIRATGSHSVFVLDQDSLEVIEKPVSALKPGDLLITFIKKELMGEGREYQLIDVIDAVGDLSKDYVDNVPKDIKELSGGKNPIPLPQYLTLERDKGVRGKVRIRRCGDDQYLPGTVVLDEDLAFAFGLYVASGYVREGEGKSVCFVLNRDEGEVPEKLLRVMKSKFNLSPSITVGGTYVVYEYSHALLAELFKKLLGANSSDKHVPSQLWKSPRRVIKSFFEGLRVGYRSKELRKGCISYRTSNEGLAYEILWLARLAGYYSELSMEEGVSQYNVLIHLEQGVRSEYGKVHVKPLLRLIELAKLKPLPQELAYINERRYVPEEVALRVIKHVEESAYLTPQLREHIEKLKQLVSGELVLIEVREVRRVPYDGYVYDVSVPGTESFFGGNAPLLLHNTGHGGLSTIHAETLDYAIKRLTSPPMNIPPAYMKLMNAFIHIQRIQTRVKKGVVRVRRRITTVQEVRDYNDYVEVVSWDPRDDLFRVDLEKSYLLEDIASRTGLTRDEVIDKVMMKKVYLDWLVRKEVLDVWEVSRYIFDFYISPDTAYRRAVKELRELGVEEVES